MLARRCFLLLIAPVLIAIAASARDKALELKTGDEKIVAPLNVAALNRLQTAALSGSPSTLGTFLPLFDRRLDSKYIAKSPGTAEIVVQFQRPQVVHFLRVYGDDARLECSLATAETLADLEASNGSFRELTPAVTSQPAPAWTDLQPKTPTTVTVLRCRFRPLDAGETVTLRELNIVAEQHVESLELKSRSGVIPLGDPAPLTLSAYLSGGEMRELSTKGVKWTLRPDTAARMTSHAKIVGRRRGPVEVTAEFGKLKSVPLALQIVEPD